MSDKLICPNCRHSITLSAALSAQLRDRLNEEVAQRLEQERERLREEAQGTAQASVASEVQDLHEQLANAQMRLGESQKSELELRKDRRELENQKKELELTVNRKLDEERIKIREEAMAAMVEEHRLQDADKDRLTEDLRRQITDLKRRVEQGSPQTQGETLEWELESFLRRYFPMDTIEPVPVGTHGGDLLQHVRDGTGSPCGTILWEFKRTKKWCDAWLPKLRNDQRSARAHVAVLATVEMPKDVSTFGIVDGVWVTNRACVLGLAFALRNGVIDVARTRRSLEGKQNKAEVLFNYLTSSEFVQKIEGIVEAFRTLKDDLDSEKRSVARLWAKREKQIDQAFYNTAGLFGDLGAIMGSSLPQIADFELASITDADTVDTALMVAAGGDRF